MATIAGTAANDVITPTLVSPGVTGGAPSDLADSIDGAGGNDSIGAAGGADTLVGGEGNDTVFGGAADDLLDSGGGAGADSLAGAAGNDTLEAYGRDTLDGGAGDDLLMVGSDGVYVLRGGTGTDRVRLAAPYWEVASFGLAAEAIESVDGQGGWIQGTAGNDLLDFTGVALDSVDRIEGFDGDDTVLGSAGADLISGGQGHDSLGGGEGDDTLVGHGGDSLDGGGGNDSLGGGDGADSLAGGAGNDTLFAEGADTLDAGAGDDLLRVWTDPSYVLQGGAGIDRVEIQSAYWSLGSFSLAANGIELIEGQSGRIRGTLGDDVIDLGGVVATGLAAVDGSDGNDRLTGTAGADSLLGGYGTDSLQGGAGNDTLAGEAGADTLAGGSGDDRYEGLGADDSPIEAAGEGTDSAFASVSLTLAPFVENLTLTGGSAIDCTGNGVANTLTGNGGANRLDGKGGADTLIGGGGNDTYWTNDAADRLVESAGGGADLVRATATYTLPVNVENLILDGLADLGATGNGQGNTLTGNGGANGLKGAGGNDRLLGEGGADTLNGGPGSDTMTGGAGEDLYVVDDQGDSVVEGPGTEVDWVQSALSYTLPDWVEELTLTGSDPIAGTGNGLDNVILGNGADNTLAGGGGLDVLMGFGGNDTYLVDDPLAIVLEDPSSGTDIVYASVSYGLLFDLEDLVLTGADPLDGLGNELGNRLTGNDSANALIGDLGNDTLAGHGGNDTLAGDSGADRLEGGTGDDRYELDDPGDYALELAGEGTDTLSTARSVALFDWIENLELAGGDPISGTGNALANILTGNAAGNWLDGADGADTIWGLGGDDYLEGGSGADSLLGGAGNDHFLIDDPLDRVLELAGEGIDTVQAGLSLSLAAELENLIIVGGLALDGTGNGLANRLTGNAAANRLDGSWAGDALYGEGGDDTLIGGPGNDAMYGGAGDDTYEVERPSDLTDESGGSGIDTVLSSVSRTLGANLERLVLTGTDAIKGVGNGLANTLTGNGANNSLDGRGGADTLIGGAGNDTYVVEGPGDSIVELDGEGSDLVRTPVAFTLVEGVENLTLTGDAAVAGTGSPGANTLTGNAGANTLDGLGGSDRLDGSGGDDSLVGGGGNDTLIGGAGLDTLKGGSGADGFQFQAVGEGVNTVADFQIGSDRLLAVSVNFGSLPVGPLDPSRLVAAGTPPAGAEPVFIYDVTDGTLWFDADGSGTAVAPSQIAVLAGAPSIGASDIELVD